MKNNITLTGMMGAGKSLIATELGNRLENFVTVDTDSLVEYNKNMSIPDMFRIKGENYFRDAETKIIEMVYEKERMVVALGGGAYERPQNREIIRANSKVIYLRAKPETIFERIKSCTSRPLLKDGFGVKEIKEILTRREPYYLKVDYVVETDGKTPDEVVNEILRLVHD